MSYSGLEGTRPYQGAASFYAQYRDAVAREFFALLADRLGWTSRDRILDLGAGPAQLSIPIAALVGEVVAVDPEPDMLAEGRRRAHAAGRSNIRFVEGRGEDLRALRGELGEFRAAVMGASFHWMTGRDEVLESLSGMIDSADGAVAFVTPFRVAVPDELQVMLERVRQLVEEYAQAPPGPHPRGGHDPFEGILARSGFPRVERIDREFETIISPTADALAGFEYTLSHTVQRLGTARATFEERVRAELGTGVLGEFVIRRRDEALVGRRADP